MSTTAQQFYKHQDLLYKFLLIIICAGFIVYFFPKSGKFKYEIQKGFPWQYENLYADEDFAILKSADELAQEKEQIKSQSAIYYEYDQAVLNKVLALYDSNFNKAFPDTLSYSSSKLELKNYGKNLLFTFYKNGVIKEKPVYNTGRLIYLKRGNEVSEMNFDNITVLSDMPDALSDAIQSSLYSEYSNRYLQVYFDGLEANITLDAKKIIHLGK